MIRNGHTLLRCVALCVASGCLVPAAVIYEFSGTVNMIGTTQMFRYTTPNIITSDTFVPASALDMCSNQGGGSLPCFGVNFLPSGPDTPQHYPELLFKTLNPDASVGIIFYYFPLGSTFATVGALTNVPTLGNSGTLRISDTAAVAIPEPATGVTVLLAGLASLGLCRDLRRRRRTL
jgi:hypothetical protein